jgi:hypothetical protein
MTDAADRMRAMRRQLTSRASEALDDAAPELAESAVGANDPSWRAGRACCPAPERTGWPLVGESHGDQACSSVSARRLKQAADERALPWGVLRALS